MEAGFSAPPVASEDPAGSVSASGEVERDSPEMRTLRVRFSREALGQDEGPLSGSGQVWVDVPCNHFGPEQLACDVADELASDPPPPDQPEDP